MSEKYWLGKTELRQAEKELERSILGILVVRPFRASDRLKSSIQKLWVGFSWSSPATRQEPSGIIRFLRRFGCAYAAMLTSIQESLRALAISCKERAELSCVGKAEARKSMNTLSLAGTKRRDG